MRALSILLIVATGCRGLLGIDEPGVIDAAPAGQDAIAIDAAPPDVGTPAQITTALLKEWSGCMSLASFQAAQMASRWSALSSSGGNCGTCHNTGANGFIATANESVFFSAISTNKYYLLGYFAVNLAQAKMVINTTNFAVVGGAQPPHTEHPTFPQSNAAMTALDQFYAATVARKAAGTCDPPRLPD